MAVGAMNLARKQAIVSRLTAIEELAGVDIFCSDKTGTLTKNEMRVADPVMLHGHSEEELFTFAVLASWLENNDPIKLPLFHYIDEHFPQLPLQDYRQREFVHTHESAIIAMIEEVDIFAEVVPEDKYRIVDTLQKGDHIVAMIGDGVNDAPALKKADCGFAVSNATDAARAAADIILTAPGLSVISSAVKVWTYRMLRREGIA